MRAGPFSDVQSLLRACDAAWDSLGDDGWLDALASNAEHVVPDGNDGTRRAAETALRLYRERFGIPFVSAAHSPVADELLMRVRIRLGNDGAAEVRAARDELRRMARQRLERSWAEAR